MDALIGKRLLAVESGWPGGTRMALPIAGSGPFTSSSRGSRRLSQRGTDCRFQVQQMNVRNESWLVPYQYNIDGRHWTMRDASGEPPFHDVRGAQLKTWTSVCNEVGEQVGLTLHSTAGPSC